MMNSAKIDCRAMFRLHALDIPAPQEEQRIADWALRRGSGLRIILADLARGYGRLRRAGADPLQGQPITGEAVIRCLGLAGREEPHGVWENLKATATLLAAATRESLRTERELAFLLRHGSRR